MTNVKLQALTSKGRWRVFIAALVVFSASVSSAASEKYDFTLKMSQDKQLCPAITKVLTTAYSFNVSPNHDWFTVIQWQALGTLGEQFRDESRFMDTFCHIDRWAIFDIDNDGQSEFVIKRSGCLGGKFTDELLVFKDDEPREHLYQALMDPIILSESLIGKISLSGEMYELKKLPTFKDKRGRKQLHAIGGQVRIDPFVFGAHTYLNLYAEYGSTWHVIAQYRPGEKTLRELEDLCYVWRQN